VIRVGWGPRRAPLVPLAVAARGAAAARLARRLLEGELEGLRACAGEGVLVVLGPAERLPWAEGVRYLGRDPAAPGLLLPTALAPTVPVDLLARALVRRARGVLAVLPPEAGLGPAVVPLVSAPIFRPALEAWLEACDPAPPVRVL
jgi:hypothetical protein